MKNSSNKIILIFILTITLAAFLSHNLLFTNKINNLFQYFTSIYFLKDAILIVITAIALKIILLRNKNSNKIVIDKLNQTNNDIIESKERYDIVAKATSETIWDWNIQDDSILWNNGIENIFGYNKDEIGKSSKWWFEQIHPEDSLKMSIKLYSFLEQKTEKWEDEYRFKCADGSYKYILDRAFLLKDKDGKPTRLIGAMQDITKRKKEEEQLKLLETVITQTKDAVVITDIDTSESVIPNILYVNPAFSNMTGYESHEVIGKSPTIFIGPNSDINELEKLKNSIKEFKECTIETIRYKKNGEEYWVNFTMVPVTNKEGKHSHWISIQRDITEEKKKQKEREQLIRELTQNNKDLKQFSYFTSHNLRAPLSNLTGILHLIDDIKIENEELRELIKGFSTSATLLNETVNDLSKIIIIRDNPSIERQDVSIEETLNNVLNQLSFLTNTCKPNIIKNLETDIIPNINKSYFESILSNLINNAIKYRASERPLNISISSKTTNQATAITIEDNGMGIDMERNRDKVFGLYQKFHNFSDSKGLGLYLVKSQIESMEGNISVESKVDKGTVFNITFNKN